MFYAWIVDRQPPRAVDTSKFWLFTAEARNLQMRIDQLDSQPYHSIWTISFDPSKTRRTMRICNSAPLLLNSIICQCKTPSDIDIEHGTKREGGEGKALTTLPGSPLKNVNIPREVIKASPLDSFALAVVHIVLS